MVRGTIGRNPAHTSGVIGVVPLALHSCQLLRRDKAAMQTLAEGKTYVTVGMVRGVDMVCGMQ